MTAQELEKLMADVTPGDWEWWGPKYGVEYDSNEGWLGGFYSNDVEICHFGDNTNYYNTCGTPPLESNARIIALAPTLARRVIAAEKLVEALKEVACRSSLCTDGGELDWLIDEAKSALIEWESAQ